MRRPLLLCLLACVVAVGGASVAEERAAASVPRLVGAPAFPHRLQLERKRPFPIGYRAARLARRWLGVGYRWGGSSPSSGFDCSGFTSYVYGRLGVRLPHNAAAQLGVGTPVPRARLRPGDLLFFNGLGHVGMYVGRGRMIHSPQSGDVVRIVRLGTDYRGVLVGARRITRTLHTRN
ncbi:MAG TPA: C40 family peptidase [Gaiellaceae bacterium]|jgi:hypothetical protein